MLRATGKRDRRQWAEKGMFLVEWNENSRHGLARNDAPYISFGYSSTKSVHTFTIFMSDTIDIILVFFFPFFLSICFSFSTRKNIFIIFLDFSFSFRSALFSFIYFSKFLPFFFWRYLRRIVKTYLRKVFIISVMFLLEKLN